VHAYALIIAVLCAGAPRAVSADPSAFPVVVRSDRAGTRYSIAPGPFVPCGSLRDCSVMLGAGRYSIKVARDDRTPGAERFFSVHGPTSLHVKNGSRATKHVGIGLTIGGGVLSLAGLFGIGLANSGNAMETEGRNNRAVLPAIGFFVGLAMILTGVMTTDAGQTKIAVSPH
jgi:hypothetical protein